MTTGCYVLPEAVFRACRLSTPAVEGELQLGDVVGLLARAGHRLKPVRLGPRVNVNRPVDVGRAADLVQ